MVSTQSCGVQCEEYTIRAGSATGKQPALLFWENCTKLISEVVHFLKLSETIKSAVDSTSATSAPPSPKARRSPGFLCRAGQGQKIMDMILASNIRINRGNESMYRYLFSLCLMLFSLFTPVAAGAAANPIIAITASKQTIGLTVGNKFPVMITAHYADGSTKDITHRVKWESSNPKIATSDRGFIVAHKIGTAKIKGTFPYNQVKFNVSLNVNVRANRILRFADPALEAGVRQEIGKPTGVIMSRDVDMLEKLDLPNRDVRDLKGICALVNMDSLTLSENRIRNLKELASCKGLEYLDLSSNQIEDLSHLASLKELKSLNVSDNDVVDLSPLSGLTQLTNLDLRNNDIEEIAPLASLQKLKFLTLQGNRISDLAPLAHLTELIDLVLLGNQFHDITPLSSLTKLDHLNLSDNLIEEFTPLQNIHSLRSLALNWMSIEDIGFLQEMPGLQDLYLVDNQIKDISPLLNMKKLTFVNLSGNPLDDETKKLQSLRDKGIEVIYP
jgi:hypothetical protein